MLVTSVLDVYDPRLLYNTRTVKRKHSCDFQLDKSLDIALGWSFSVLRKTLKVIQGWGPRASPLFERCTTHLVDASGILHFGFGGPLGGTMKGGNGRTCWVYPQ
eukprot:804662-Prorocentrum_minimum.AAC.1